MKKFLTDQQKKDCLAYDPFAGDFGSPGDRTLKDKIVVARKPGPCGMCRQNIMSGSHIRVLSAIFDGEMFSYRWCYECCMAMALAWTDGGDVLEARIAMAEKSGQRREKEQP